ncbi:hypothetical protein [Salinarchaeum laminariae]|uniref:hypothetical protein n=1 Tax=Salinarchaeum laminariae TaxID=869888 RepID=UPI0020BFB6BD|nr:hypothetical protein [Salinarchaeum laminariae]
MKVIDPMANRTEYVGVRLTPDEHDKFEKHIESSNEFDSMSRFFRVLAHRDVAADDEDVSVDADEIIDAVNTAVSPLAERLEQVEEHIVSIDSNVRNDDKIDRLARDLYSTLPVHADESELPDLGKAAQHAKSDLAKAQSISTAELWAEYFSEDLQDMRRACARMEEYFPDVQIVRAEVDSDESSLLHGDVSVESPTSHTDQSTGIDRTVSTSSNPGSETTVRRYFKTRGE